MTPEEIQNTIEQMLGVQRQIQESQIRNTANIAANAEYIQENAELIRSNREDIRSLKDDVSSLKEDIRNLVVEIAKSTVDQREKFNQFYGYHQSADTQRLDIVERLIKVEQEVAQLKRQLSEGS
ncbi:hypothetical protein [Calothrix sp. CCY 0018]|uniref:hypothetical protein n=1 Tax=Calothrix sp. CCY 0018 TaxID=3103864 RepID=UPI0039C695FC